MGGTGAEGLGAQSKSPQECEELASSAVSGQERNLWSLFLKGQHWHLPCRTVEPVSEKAGEEASCSGMSCWWEALFSLLRNGWRAKQNADIWGEDGGRERHGKGVFGKGW